MVCSDCVKDDALRGVICRYVGKFRCDYCGRNSPPFGYGQELFDFVYKRLLLEYGDPWEHGIYWDKEDGDWIGIRLLDTYDVLNEVGDPLDDGGDLSQSFADTVEHDWYLIGSEVGSDEEIVVWSWDSFERRLLGGPRFLFSATATDPDNPPEMSANQLFEFLADLGGELQTDFVKRIEAGLPLFRARACPNCYFNTPEGLGSPPSHLAMPQRLSTAGVACFYASEDSETALTEAKPEASDYVSVGHWKTTRPLVYADFANPLEMPSLFDQTISHNHRLYVRFLQEFVTRVTRPADTALGDANSYLATQVLGEFLRYHLQTEWKLGVDAVRFPSSLFSGGTNWVLFGQPDRESEPRVELLDVTHFGDGSDDSGHRLLARQWAGPLWRFCSKIQAATRRSKR